MAWVLKQEIGDPIAKHVLMCLANYAGEDGENAFPSVSRLQRDTELSERTIRLKLDFLVTKGFIKLGDQQMSAAYAKRKDRQTTCYDFVLRGASAAPRESNGVQLAQNGVQLTTPRGAGAAPNPSEIRQLTKSALKSIPEVLQAREQPPGGRQPDFDSEYRKRFGMDPK